MWWRPAEKNKPRAISRVGLFDVFAERTEYQADLRTGVFSAVTIGSSP